MKIQITTQSQTNQQYLCDCPQKAIVVIEKKTDKMKHDDS